VIRAPRTRAALLLAALLTPAAARAALPPYAEESSLIATTPATDDGSIAAMLNPAQWGLLQRPETALWWSDQQTLGGRREDYGISAGRGLGFSRSEERRVGKECRSRWSPYH